jgi:hypothetical protein
VQRGLMLPLLLGAAGAAILFGAVRAGDTVSPGGLLGAVLLLNALVRAALLRS